MKMTLKSFMFLKWFKVENCCFVIRGFITFFLIWVTMSGLAHSKFENVFIDQPNDTIYSAYQVDKNPEYPGGLAECFGFINKNIDREKCEGKEGRVILDFVVNSDGSLSDIKVLRGIERKVDKEIVSIVKKMPKWNPGTLNGNPVRVKFALPVMVKFKFDDDCDTPASFPGGQKELERFLADNVAYVKDENWPTSGLVKVLVSFIVDEFGRVRNVLVREGVNFQVDQEAVRVIEKMPMWTPAMKGDKPIPTLRYVHVPVFVYKTPRFDGAI